MYSNRPRAFLAHGILAVALCAWMSSQTDAGSGGWIEFDNQTAQRLIADPGVGISDPEEKDYAWGDVDQDGDIDIVCVRKQPWTTAGRKRNVLFMNEGTGEGHAVNGVFVDRTAEYIPGFLDLTNDRDVILADVTGDGWLDIITAVTVSQGLPHSISHPRVYVNQGLSGGVWQGYVFEDARIPQFFTIPGGLAVTPRFCSVIAGDIDEDGDNDLYFGDYDSSGAGGGSQQPAGTDLNDRLLINDGNGFFTDSLETRMTEQMLRSAFGMAVAIADMNGDGHVDVVKDTGLTSPGIYVSISYNDPDNVGFFDQFDEAYSGGAPYHVSLGDLNNDGWLDMVITDDGADRFLLNQGPGPDGIVDFISKVYSFEQGSDDGFGGNNLVVDLNNDGFNDVIIADVDVDLGACQRRMHIYRNLGNLPSVTLQEQGGQAPWSPNGVHDFAVFDFDGDGWNDMFIGTCFTTQVWMNLPPVSVLFTYPDGLPGELVPGVPTTFRVNVEGVGINPIPDSGKQFVSVDDGPFVESAMLELEPNLYHAVLPGVACTSIVRFYVTIDAEGGETFSDPPAAPDSSYSALAAYGSVITFEDRFETEIPGWTVENIDLQGGAWERVDPVGTVFGGDQAQPEDDFGAAADEKNCYVTGQHNGGDAFASDVDGGPTILTSPVIDLEGTDAFVSYARWHFTALGNPDPLITEITNNGLNWVEVDVNWGTGSNWELHSFKVSDFVVPTSTVRVRFVVRDAPQPSLTESAIDNFTVTEFLCEDTVPPEVVHGAAGFSFETNSFGGYIDPRLESDDGSSLNLGLDRVTLVFSEPVNAIGGGPLSPSSFAVAETGDATAPEVIAVETEDNMSVEVIFNRIITLQEWTTIVASVEDLSGNAIEPCDPEPCDGDTDRVDLAFLPGDIDQGGSVQPLDLLRFRQILTGAYSPAQGVDEDYADTDRSGAILPLDLLRYRQLLLGQTPATQEWAGQELLHERP